MARGLQVCYEALYNALKGINGSTGMYNYNLEGRVIPKLILPDEAGAPKRPYICLPMADTGAYLEQGEWAIRAALRQQIIGFLDESYEDEITACSGYKAQLLRNDIERAIWPATGGTWNLGEESIEDVQFVGKEVAAGQPDDLPFASAVVTVDVITRYGRDDLAA